MSNEMHQGRPGWTWFSAALLLATLGACGQNPAAPRPAMIQPISNAQQMDDAVALLDQGQEGKARKLLKQMVKRDPDDAAAVRLLESLSADPKQLLGNRSFTYRVHPGDTMMGLSERFLGDRLNFYALARYNDLSVPSSLKSGQALQIPGTAPKMVPRAAEKPRAAVASPPPTPSVPARAPVIVDRERAGSLRGEGLAALHQGELAQAVVLLHEASTLDPGNAAIKRDLDRAIRIRRSVKARQ